MIQESYVTFEQAQSLKELGFPQYYKNANCIVTSDKLTCLAGSYDEEALIELTKGEEFNITYYYKLDGEYLNIPTLSIVQKWLREEKYFIINVLYNVNNKDWYYWLYVNNESSNEETDFKTYEQALSAGIDKCIEMLKL